MVAIINGCEIAFGKDFGDGEKSVEKRSLRDDDTANGPLLMCYGQQ